jgi:sodium transport system permease protein
MRWSVVRTIWLREVRDQLRDRRTLFMLVVLPLLLYPLLGIAMAHMSQLFQGQPLTIGVAGYELVEADTFFPALVHQEGKSRRFLQSLFYEPQEHDQLRVVLGAQEDLEEALRKDDIHAYLVFTPEFVGDVKAGKQAPIDVRLKGELPQEAGKPLPSGRPGPPLLSSDDDRSRLAYQRLRPVIREWEAEIARKRMLALGKPADYVRPLIVPLLKPKTEKIWSKIFPFLIIMMSLTGALYPAIDVCAGEKERGTMETLLISPASRSEIVVGKFLTVWVFSAAMALLNLASLGVTALVFSEMFASAAALTGSEGLPAPGLTSILWCVVLLVPLAAFFSAVCLALAVYARSSKEGQYYLMPLMVATMMLTFLSLAPGIELSPVLSMLPVSGAALLLQSLMAAQAPEQVPWLYLAPVLIPLAAYCYLALHWAIVQFSREEVLFREAERLDLRLWLARLFREKGPLPTPGMALACFLALLLLRWVLSAYGAGLHPLVLLAVLQVVGVATPALVMATLLTNSPRLTLRLRWPRLQEDASATGFLAQIAPQKGLSLVIWSLGGAVLAVAMHAPLAALLLLLIKQFPGLQEQLENFKHLVRTIIGPETPLFNQLLALAVLPAICEELMFRGFILSGLAQRLGVRRAIIVSSILFAFAHLSAFQFLPTLILGLILAMLATRSGSLLPGMVFHLIHNGFITLAANTEYRSGESWTALFGAHGLYSWPATIAGLLVAGFVLLVLLRLPPRPLLDEPTPGE